MNKQTIEFTTPDEFLIWVSTGGVDICLDAMKNAGNKFGCPLLFGLSEDGTHHVSSLAFWEKEMTKDESMNRVRDIVAAQKIIACGFMSKSLLKADEEEEHQIVLMIVLAEKDKPATMHTRMINTNDSGNLSIGDPVVHDEVSGRLTKFWN